MRVILLAACCLLLLYSPAQQTVGLFTDTTGSLEGYVLFAPIKSDTTYLIDKCGKRIHQWASDTKPGLSVYLLPDGSLLKTGALPNATFAGTGGAGGEIERYDWNDNLLWKYTISSDSETQNHDIFPMPNGNVLVDIWEYISPAEAIAAGRKPAITGTALWSARIEELQPVGTDSAVVVWQWRLWDHLVQDFDSAKANYGVVADHPELLNVNFYQSVDSLSPDWIHMNAINYDSALDQVMFSGHNLNEIYIIDHSTTTAEAASHSGGVHGMGGDFLYRWGNPQAYGRGTKTDRKLYQQHDPVWIPAGYAGSGNIMIFNNGFGRPGGDYSSVDIIAQPVDSAGDYSITAGQAFGPSAAYWSYSANPAGSFYSDVMGSGQRLSNGNTLICDATSGRFFEVDSNMNTVWDYVNPVDSAGILAQGDTSSSNQAFRCIFYAPDYAAFAGQNLTPGNPIEINPLPYNCNMLSSITENTKQEGTINVSNPFMDNIYIFADADLLNADAILTDVTGRNIGQWNSLNLKAGERTELDVQPSLADGVYILTIRNGSYSYAAKIVRQGN